MTRQHSPMPCSGEHDWYPNYLVLRTCMAEPRCTMTETHCRTCGFYISVCGCGCCNGASLTSWQRYAAARAKVKNTRATIINHALDELAAIERGISGPLGVALLKTWFPKGFRHYPPAFCADALELIRSALRTPQKWQINSAGEAVRRASGKPNSYADLEPR